MKIVTGRVRATPATLDELLGISVEHVQRSRDEPGCLFHSIWQSAEDPLDLFFYEEWESDEALQQHFGVEEVLAFVTKVRELAAKPPSMEIFEADRAGED
jgi:quinol monooxygenase YgiN